MSLSYCDPFFLKKEIPLIYPVQTSCSNMGNMSTQERNLNMSCDFMGLLKAALIRKCVFAFFQYGLQMHNKLVFSPTRSDKSSLSQQPKRPTACHSSTVFTTPVSVWLLPHDFSEFRSPSNRSPAIWIFMHHFVCSDVTVALATICPTYCDTYTVSYLYMG